MGYCKKHGEYRILCIECDLEQMNVSEVGDIMDESKNESLFELIDRLEKQCDLYESEIALKDQIIKSYSLMLSNYRTSLGE